MFPESSAAQHPATPATVGNDGTAGTRDRTARTRRESRPVNRRTDAGQACAPMPRSFCRECPVTAHCLEQSLMQDDRWGWTTRRIRSVPTE